MAFSGVTMHIHPTFTADGNIDSNGNYSLNINATSTSGSSSYGYTMRLYIVFNDGNYVEIGSFSGYSSHRFSGQVSTAGKTSAQFSMYCSMHDNGGGNCDISASANTAPGMRFGDSFTLYKAPSNISLNIIKSDTNSITVRLSWTNGTKTGYGYTAADTDGKSSWLQCGNGSDYKIPNLKSNTYYIVYGKVDDGTAYRVPDQRYWTYPLLQEPTLNLVEGYEHDQIHVVANIDVASEYDQYRFKLGENGEWTEYQNDPEYIFTDLDENTEYKIYTQTKNTQSKFESEPVYSSITTWYDPLTDLEIILENRWFWYLDISTDYIYNGTIDKYEFFIGEDLDLSDEEIIYEDMETINDYIVGSLDPFDEKKLKYNSEYLCGARLTDNHGRIYTAKTTYMTLDERPLYVDGELREVKVILPDNTIHYITPNLLTVINDNNTTVNMNKIINNDDRTEFQ